MVIACSDITEFDEKSNTFKTRTRYVTQTGEFSNEPKFINISEFLIEPEILTDPVLYSNAGRMCMMDAIQDALYIRNEQQLKKYGHIHLSDDFDDDFDVEYIIRPNIFFISHEEYSGLNHGFRRHYQSEDFGLIVLRDLHGRFGHETPDDVNWDEFINVLERVRAKILKYLPR